MSKERIEQIMEKVTKRNLANVLCGNKTSEVDNEILELLNEVTRLTNNWNELEDAIDNEVNYYIEDEDAEWFEAKKIQNIMKEIKEGNNVSSRNKIRQY